MRERAEKTVPIEKHVSPKNTAQANINQNAHAETSRTETSKTGMPIPALSVLIPFYNDNPSELIKALALQSDQTVEILLYDDGTANAELTRHVEACIATLDSPHQIASQTTSKTAFNPDLKMSPAISKAKITLMTALKNKGRSAARNALQARAKADWVLFLDADMRPQTPHFLKDYLGLIKDDTADIIFGGFTVLETSETPEQELHRALSEVSDCLDAKTREDAGPQFVASSNLCVRKTVLDSEKFDAGFTGWGWEDSEWAARVAQKYTLKHADIPAIHLGLETTDTLLSRFRDSAQNYVRFTNKHPDLAQKLTLYKTAQKLKKIPGQRVMRPLLKQLVCINAAPIKARLLALKLWRASWYAEALP